MTTDCNRRVKRSKPIAGSTNLQPPWPHSNSRCGVVCSITIPMTSQQLAMWCDVSHLARNLNERFNFCAYYRQGQGLLGLQVDSHYADSLGQSVPADWRPSAKATHHRVKQPAGWSAAGITSCGVKSSIVSQQPIRTHIRLAGCQNISTTDYKSATKAKGPVGQYLSWLIAKIRYRQAESQAPCTLGQCLAAITSGKKNGRAGQLSVPTDQTVSARMAWELRSLAVFIFIFEVEICSWSHLIGFKNDESYWELRITT